MLSHGDDVRRYFRRNYTIHCIEGGLFIGGMAFVAPNTVLPKMVESLGGPTWLIAICPMLMTLGFVTPTLLTAHLVERLHAVKPVLLCTGFLQRIPFLGTAVVLYYFTETHASWALASVTLAQFLSGILGGITMTAWLELVAKTIPENRRSSVWAMRFIISSAIGIGAGGMIASVLETRPGPEGYAFLHLILFGFLMSSYAIFALIRETAPPADKPSDNHSELWENLKSVPKFIRSDRDLRNYLATHGLMNGMFIMIPFLSIHSLRVLDRPESYLGFLVVAHMFGGIVGNVLAGYLGDRHGGKIVMLLSRAVFFVLAVWTSVAETEWEFAAIFFLFGSAFFGNQVGTTTFCIEISPLGKRATYLAIMSTLTAIPMAAASILSTILWNWREDYTLLGAATGLAMIASTFFLHRIEEPRKRSAGHWKL